MSLHWLKNLGFVLLLACAGSGAALAAGAPPADDPAADGMGGAPMAGPGMQRALEKLNLSDAQRADMKKLMEGARKDMREMMDRRHKAMQAMKEDQDNGAWDEAKARQRAREYGDVATEMSFLHQRINHDMQKILTPEQWKKMQSMREEHRHQMRKRMMQGHEGSHRAAPPVSAPDAGATQ